MHTITQRNLSSACLVLAILLLLTAPCALAEEEAAVETEEAEEVDYTTLANPQPNTKESIARGRMIYLRHCTACHGPDGKSEIDMIADATNLTTPEMYLSGTTQGEVYNSLLNGAGMGMPPYRESVENADLWHMVNFMLNLWPASERPPVVKEATSEDNSKSEGDTDEKE